MPLNPKSLNVTEAYRKRMVGIRNRAKREAAQTWSRVKLQDLDATYNPGMLALHVSVMQREAAQLSAGYLGAFIASETGDKIPTPTAFALGAGDARSGAPLLKAFRSPMIGVKTDIKAGMDPTLAYHKGGSRLVRAAGLATDEVAREALRVAMDAAPEVEGYKRAVKGTCGACSGLADASTLPPGTPLEIHPDCQCISEPVLKAQETRLESEQTSTYMQSKRYQLTSEQARTAQRWQGFDSKLPNEWMREGKPLWAHDRDFVKAMDDLLDAAGPIGQNAQVYRGIPADSLGHLGNIEDLVGKVFSDPGFVATTPLRGELSTWAGASGKRTIWDLTVQQDVKAVWEETATGQDWGLQELVLERDARFVVTKVTKTEAGDFHIQATVLPPKAKPPLPPVRER